MLASTAPVAWRATRPVSRVMLRRRRSRDLRLGVRGRAPGWPAVLAGGVRMSGCPARGPMWRGTENEAPAATGGGGSGLGSAAQAETLDQSSIAADISVLEIIQQLAALVNHSNHAPPGVVVSLVGFKVAP